VLMVPDNFKEWACSLSGCDGGNPRAKVWLCGIEWGVSGNRAEEYYREQLPLEIKEGRVDLIESEFDWGKSIKYPFGRSFAKLFAALKGEKVERYKNVIEQCSGLELFKLNLYPIAFNSTQSRLWIKHGLKDITGFDEKHLFKTWCFMNRFPEFSRLRTRYKPDLIICTGISYLRDFFACFGGSQENSGEIKYAEIEPISENNKKKKRRYYWVKLDGGTTLVVVPFFSGANGLNSNFLLQEMGDKIRALST